MVPLQSSAPALAPGLASLLVLAVVGVVGALGSAVAAALHCMMDVFGGVEVRGRMAGLTERLFGDSVDA